MMYMTAAGSEQKASDSDQCQAAVSIDHVATLKLWKSKRRCRTIWPKRTTTGMLRTWTLTGRMPISCPSSTTRPLCSRACLPAPRPGTVVGEYLLPSADVDNIFGISGCDYGWGGGAGREGLGLYGEMVQAYKFYSIRHARAGLSLDTTAFGEMPFLPVF